MTDSVLTGMKKQFKTLFISRAGMQPNHIYQKCFKAYMSLMCSSLFPMCTNPQGRDEMIPFLGRVPTCFTACFGVIAACPGFQFSDIQGPCTEISVPPICTQAAYFRDDPQTLEQFVESELEGKMNSKCADYDPAIDAGQDPLLYETEPVQKLFHKYHEMQVEVR